MHTLDVPEDKEVIKLEPREQFMEGRLAAIGLAARRAKREQKIAALREFLREPRSPKEIRETLGIAVPADYLEFLPGVQRVGKSAQTKYWLP